MNEAGTGDFSDSPGTTECGTPDVRPEPPTAPTVTFGDGELQLDWEPGPNRGSAIIDYEIRISLGTSANIRTGSDVSDYLWTDCVNGTDYTFEVRAQNDAVSDNDGWSEWSATSAAEHCLTVPDAPAQPVALRGDRQVQITWGAPADGGDPITLYQVQSSLDATWIDVTPQGPTNTYTWENIPNGTDVSFRVRAINRDPRSTTPGNISPDSPVVRTCSVPDAPGVPTVDPGDTQVTGRLGGAQLPGLCDPGLHHHGVQRSNADGRCWVDVARVHRVDQRAPTTRSP